MTAELLSLPDQIPFVQPVSDGNDTDVALRTSCHSPAANPAA
jgi:hypothetical protein